MTTYKLVQYVEGQFYTVESTPENVFAAFEVRGYAASGAVENNPARRPELQGHPKFIGLNGPMWDGPGQIRYETPEAYRVLSA